MKVSRSVTFLEIGNVIFPLKNYREIESSLDCLVVPSGPVLRPKFSIEYNKKISQGNMLYHLYVSDFFLGDYLLLFLSQYSVQLKLVLTCWFQDLATSRFASVM